MLFVTDRKPQTRIRHPNDLAAHREDGLVADERAGRRTSRVHDDIWLEVQHIVQCGHASNDVAHSRRQDRLVEIGQVEGISTRTTNRRP